MRNQISFLALISLTLLWSCGEAGLETDISKINEIEFTVSNLTAEGIHSERASVNLADEEFAEYLGDIEQFKVNKIEVQIASLNADLASISPYVDQNINTSINGSILVLLDNIELMSVVYEGGNSGTDGHELFHDQGNLKITDRIVLYDEANPSNVQVQTTQEAINILLSALENRSTLNADFLLSGRFENANMTMKIFLDLTARAQLN